MYRVHLVRSLEARSDAPWVCAPSPARPENAALRGERIKVLDYV